MRGSIKRVRPGVWRIRLDLPRGADGRRRQRQITVHGTREQAERVLADLLAKVGRGEYVEPSRETLEAFLLRWIESLEGRVRPSTIATYRYLLMQHVIPHVGHVPLGRLTALDLQEMYAELLRTEKRRGTGTLSATTVRHVHRTLYAALEDAVNWGLIIVNPASRTKPPQRSRRTVQPYSRDELRRLLNAARETRYYVAIVLAGLVGLRKGEIIALRWRDVDWERKRLHVTRSEGQVEGESVLGPTKTPSGTRAITISDAILAAFRQHRLRQAEERLRAGPMWEDHDRVLTDRFGRPVHGHTLSKAFRGIARRAGVPVLRFHMLRHTYASLAGSAGVPLKVLSARLGHASIDITADTYQHLYPSDDEAAATALDDLLR